MVQDFVHPQYVLGLTHCPDGQALKGWKEARLWHHGETSSCADQGGGGRVMKEVGTGVVEKQRQADCLGMLSFLQGVVLTASFASRLASLLGILIVVENSIQNLYPGVIDFGGSERAWLSAASKPSLNCYFSQGGAKGSLHFLFGSFDHSRVEEHSDSS